MLGDLVVNRLGLAQPVPKVLSGREGIDIIVAPGQEVMLDYAFARSWRRQTLGRGFARTPLPAASRRPAFRKRILPPPPQPQNLVSQKVIRALLLTALDLVAGDDDPAIRKGLLLADLVVRPTRFVELGQDVLAPRIRFGE